MGASAALNRAIRAFPVDGWTLAILAWTVVFGVVVRSWRIVDTLSGTDDGDALVWIPLAVGVDLGFAVVVWLLCGLAVWPTRRSRLVLVRAAGRAVAVAVAVFVAVLGVANVLSFRVSGTALTWHRLRGDDGATARDMNMIDWGEAGPLVILLCASLLGLAAALLAAHRADRRLLGEAQQAQTRTRRGRALLAFLAVTAVTWAVYEVALDGSDRGFGRHPAGVLVDSWLERYRRRPAIVKEFVPPPASPEGFAALLTPAQPSPPVPAPVRASTAPTRNLIVFFAEGVAREHTSLAPGGPATTPLLKARASREGLEMTRFYSPFHRSIQAIYSLLCGDFPTPTGTSISDLNPRIDCGEFSQVLSKQGVHVGLFHGGYFSFYDKTAFVGDRGYERMLDAPALQKQAPRRPDGSDWEEDAWGIDDRATVAALLQWIDEVQAQKAADGKAPRFAAVAIPITAHYPFTVPSDVDKPFGDGRKLDRFWNAVHFLDLAFEQLMQGLEARGLLDDTTVIFVADHGESPLEPPRETNVDRAMYEHNVHVPMVVFDRHLFPQRQVSERLASIPDILPTLLDVMQLPDSHDRQGTSFLADPWQEKRIFLGAMRSNVNQLGFIDGTSKFVFDLGRGRTELYDLVEDPDELQNLASGHPALMAKNTEIVLTWSKWQLARLRDAPHIDDDIDVQDGIARAARVRFRARDPQGGGAFVDCSDDVVWDVAGRRACPGAPGLLEGLTTTRVAKRTRFCLPVQLPEGGGDVEFSVGDVPFWRYVSSLRFVYPAGVPRLPLTVRLAVDDQPERVLDTSVGTAKQRFLFGAPTQSLKVTVSSSEATPSPICLFFDEASWRPRPRAIREWKARWAPADLEPPAGIAAPVDDDPADDADEPADEPAGGPRPG